jgi:hypothetical protein
MKNFERLPHEPRDNNEDKASNAKEKPNRRDFLKSVAGAAGVAAGFSESNPADANDDLNLKAEILNLASSHGNLVHGVDKLYQSRSEKHGEIARGGIVKYLRNYRDQCHKGRDDAVKGEQSLYIKHLKVKRLVDRGKSFHNFVLTGEELGEEQDPQLSNLALGKIPIRPKIMETRIQEAALQRAAASQQEIEEFEIVCWQAAESGGKDLSHYKKNMFDIIKRESSAENLSQKAAQVVKDMHKYGFAVDLNKTKRIIYGELQRKRVEWSLFFDSAQKR